MTEISDRNSGISLGFVAWEIRVDAGAPHVVASLGVDVGPVLDIAS